MSPKGQPLEKKDGIAGRNSTYLSPMDSPNHIKDATKRGRGAKAFYSAGEETFKSYIVYSRNTR